MKLKQLFFIAIIPFMVMVAGCNGNQFNLTQDNSAGNELIDEALKEMRNQMSWDYPVKPGMEEWNNLKTEQERIDALQVPENILTNLSSDEFVKLCISFPSFGHYTAFNTPQEGFSIMVSRYKFFQYLLSKKDVGKYLIVAYKDADMSGFRTLPFSNDFWTIKLDYLELVISQKNILESLTQEEKVELLLETQVKVYEKANSETFSSIPGLQSSIRILAGILDIDEYPELNQSSKRQMITSFIQTGILEDTSLIDYILDMSNNYINAKK